MIIKPVKNKTNFLWLNREGFDFKGEGSDRPDDFTRSRPGDSNEGERKKFLLKYELNKFNKRLISPFSF